MHRMMMGGMMGAGVAHGVAGFLLFHMIMRTVRTLVFLGLIIAVVYFWAKSRNRGQDWD